VGRGVKFLSFNGFLWTCAAVITLWLLAVPPIMNEWARRTWKEIPCHVNTDQSGTTLIYYEVDDQMYVSTRVDFWQADFISDKRKPLSNLEHNSTCWISPRHAPGAVLRLDVLTNWSAAKERLMVVGFVLAVAGGLTWFGGKRTRKT
jgi:hypothetical protein